MPISDGDEPLAATTRQFGLNGSSRINGERVDMAGVDTVVDTTGIREVNNHAGRPHNFPDSTSCAVGAYPGLARMASVICQVASPTSRT